ncbi:MAG: TonB-dependent receptor, partial [Acidobacteria bacterium]|nr:TonB-dependent receptor [Acidobacteriota bacterium]
MIRLVAANDDHEVAATRTDSNGAFAFARVPPGRYKLGYLCPYCADPRLQTPVITVHSDQTTTVDLQLPLQTVSESVTVAAGQQQSVEQVSKTVDVIDQQELRDRADFTLVDSLRTIPGFRVQQLGGFGRVATIKTRGLRNQDTAVLIDGIRFRDPTSITGDSGAFLSDFTLTSIGKIEVLRGSGSSLYGTNAIGGVVDYQTPEAAKGTNIRVGGAWGGYGLQRYRVNWSHGASNGKFGITGAVSRTQYTRGLDGQDQSANTSLQTRIDTSPTTKTSFSGRLFFSDANVRLNVNPDTKGTLPAANAVIIDAVSNVNFVPDANDPDSKQKTRFFSGQFVVNHVVNSTLFINGYYQGLSTRRTNDDGPLGPGFQSASTSGFDGEIHTVNAHLNWTAPQRNTLTVGYEFELERFRNTGHTPSG